MLNYIYICTHCHSEFPASKVDERDFYLCPNCGETPVNGPLRGILQIQYDYGELKKHYNRQFFLQQAVPGQFWNYPLLWPLQIGWETENSPFVKISNTELSRLALHTRKVSPFRIKGHDLLVLDETGNPTYSFKDRASILVALKARQLGIKEISAASTGNAGSSLAGICARLRLASHLWVPETIPEAKLMQMLAYGAQVHIVRGDYDLAFDLCLELSRKKNWYNRNTAYNPLTIEGKKSAAYDIFLELKGDLPEYIFVPAGDGVILAGIYKGFCELRQLGIIDHLPQLYAVQSSGSDALVRFSETGHFEYRPAETIADSISAGAPRNLYLAARAIHETGGKAVAVQDSEIVDAQKTIAEQTGILVEPAAAASLAGYLQVSRKLAAKKGLLLFTGSGLKDLASLKRLHQMPTIFSAEIWRERFGRS